MRFAVAGLIASLAAAVGCFLAARRTRTQDGQPGGPSASLAWWLFGIGALWSVVDLGASVLTRLDPALLRLGVFLPLILLVVGTATYPTIRGLWSLLDQLVVATAVLTIILLVGEVQAPRGAVSFDSYLGLEPVSLILLRIMLGVSACWLVMAARSPVAVPEFPLALSLIMFSFSLPVLGATPWIDAPAGWRLLFACWLLLLASLRPFPSPPNDQVSLPRRLLPPVVVVVAILAAGVVWFALGPVIGVIAGLVLAVLEMVRRVAAPGKTELSSRPDWPTRLRSPSVLLISLGLVGVWLVYQTLLVSPRPPPSETPGIAFAVRDLYPGPEHGFRIDVHLRVPPRPPRPLSSGCANPVEVTAIISGTPELWKQAGRSLDGPTDFGIGVLSYPGAYDIEARLAGDATAPLDPYGGFGLGSSPIDRTVKATFRPAEADRDVHMVSGSIERWASSWIPLVVTFKADWVQRRSFGSCYVRLPSLTGNGAAGVASR